MMNLHKYYYKDYFSGIDFSSITKKEMIEEMKKQRKELESNNDPVTRNVTIPNLDREVSRLGDEIKKITNSNEKSISDRNKVLTANTYTKEILKNCNPPRLYKDNEEQTKPIELKIQYPGLVTGIGIDHEAKIVGEFKLGVHFDWTYGMPVVYGSSVKGVLRSWFKDIYLHGDGNYYEKCGKIEYGDLLMDIFEGAYDRDIEAEKKKYEDKWEDKIKDPNNRIYKKHKSIYERDIFFDAVIVAPDNKVRILCSDSITPHGDNPLKNPVPITFLKIAPGCTLKFRFKLQESKIQVIDKQGNPVNDENGKPIKKPFEIDLKNKLFKEILTTVGVGAKTNVGYGQLKVAGNE